LRRPPRTPCSSTAIYGGQTVNAADGWQPLRSRFLIPAGAATILPRLIGTGSSQVWLDDVAGDEITKRFGQVRHDVFRVRAMAVSMRRFRSSFCRRNSSNRQSIMSGVPANIRSMLDRIISSVISSRWLAVMRR